MKFSTNIIIELVILKGNMTFKIYLSLNVTYIKVADISRKCYMRSHKKLTFILKLPIICIFLFFYIIHLTHKLIVL